MANTVRTVIAITGASGQLGRRAAEHALSNQSGHLILVTRSPDKIGDLAQRGAEVRQGDFAHPAGLVQALAGVERLILISNTDLSKRTAEHGGAVEAARSAGVRHVIYTSIVGADPPNPAIVAPGHFFTEQAIRKSGMSWTFLRNGLYADYQAPEATRAIQSGKLVHNRGDGRAAYVAREDCALVAATILLQGSHQNAILDVTGPHAWSAAELAALYSELSGRKVESVALDDAAFIAGIVGASGGDDHARYGAELVASFGRAIREGYLASCTDVVAKVTGRPAKTLREVLAAKLKPAGGA